MLLDAAYLPPAPGLEPGIALFPPVELSPGSWRRAEAALDVPEHARRLTIAVGDPAMPRYTGSRVLGIAEAVPYFMSLAGRELRPSVTAWVIASHVAQRMHEGTMRPRGEAATDVTLAKVAASFPDSAHSVLVELGDETDFLGLAGGDEDTGWGRLTSQVAFDGFLDVAKHALVVGVQHRAPQKRSQSRVLNGLKLRLALPRRTDAPWLLEVGFADELAADGRAKIIEEAGRLFAPFTALTLRGPIDPIELTSDQASALVQLTEELNARGATLELPRSFAEGIDALIDARMRLGNRGESGPREPGAKRGRGSGRGSSQPRFRLEDLVSYDLEVALGGQQVDAAELRELARRTGALVRIGTEWVALTDATRDQLERLARVVESRDAHMANSHALAAALSGTAALPGGIVARVEQVDDGALRRALDHLKSPDTFPVITDTPGFTGKLRAYQQAGLDWLAGMQSLPLGACLADDMGLGKTVQVIALLSHMKSNFLKDEAARNGEEVGEATAAGADADEVVATGDPAVDAQAGKKAHDDSVKPQFRALVTCPTSLIGNWERELERFCPTLKVYVHHGPQRTTRATAFDGYDVVVTSYGLIARDRDLMAARGWDITIFDEAQSVKNPDTEQARAVRALPSMYRVALTGTPMENRLLELWAILDLLNPGLLGRPAAFSRRFAVPIERGGDEEAATTLRRITRPFLLRRVKHDPLIVPDLPEKQEQTIACTLTPEQAAMYGAIADQAMTEVRRRDGIARRGAVLALLTRLKQVCNHPLQALGRGDDPEVEGRSGKLDRMESMLKDIVSTGERSLVFTQYAQMGNILQRYLPDTLGCDVLYLHGGVPRLQREALVQRFQTEGDDPMVFVLSLKAGGLGLNLMQAAHVFHYDRWWNPAVEDQATDRTHRIGQTRSIQVHKLVCAGTLEERIAQIIDEKRALAGRVIEVSGGGEGWVSDLGDDELEALISLSASNILGGDAADLSSAAAGPVEA